VLRKESKYNSC